METRITRSSIVSLKASGRVTPREVLEAYRETGLRVTFMHWYLPRARPLACALSAVAKHNGVGNAETLATGLAAGDMLEDRMLLSCDAYSYRDGFAEGFDGTIRNPDWPHEDADWQGYRDGKRARAFVKARLG